MKFFTVMAALFLLLLFSGKMQDASAFAKKPQPAPVSPSAKKKYMCPMRCIVSEKPGKCPKCGMEMWELS